MTLWAIAALWLTCAGAAVWLMRRPLVALWREPVMRHPVLIVESDDWGPAPEAHAARLREIASVLGKYRDVCGRAPVMTLGVVLAHPAAGAPPYRRVMLNDPRYSAVYAAMREGEAAGVFALQLHGMEHFRPASVLRAAETHEEVRDWLARDDAVTEDLPSALQSRWVDASRLPSRPLEEAEVRASVNEEVAAYAQLFGGVPHVVVPPTFVWTEAVERAWAQAGVRVIVTPGRRFESRGADGRPVAALLPAILNGERGAGGVLYVVRDDYFEPAYGHDAARALAAVRRKALLGRPALLETHRFNFTRDADVASRALRELDCALREALRAWPHLRFVSPAELAQAWHSGDDDLVERRLRPRVICWLRRAQATPRLRKLAWATGLVAPATLLYAALGGATYQAGRIGAR